MAMGCFFDIVPAGFEIVVLNIYFGRFSVNVVKVLNIKAISTIERKKKV